MPSRAPLRAALESAISTVEAVLADDALLRSAERFAEIAIDTLEHGNRIYACGNGGSLAGAMHFAEELSGRFRRDRRPLPALAFSDPATLSCIANDFGFDSIFARQVEAHARAGDLVVLLSTSGASPNLVSAAQSARDLDVFTVGLLGQGGGKLRSQVDLPIVIPDASTSDRIQELHLIVLHAVIEIIERRLFPRNYDEKGDPER